MAGKSFMGCKSGMRMMHWTGICRVLLWAALGLGGTLAWGQEGVSAGAQDNPAQSSDGQADIRWQQWMTRSDDYLERLQELYLTDDPQKALVEHINSLLATVPYRTSRLVTPKRRGEVHFSLELGKQGELLVRQTRYDDEGNMQVSLDRREFFGSDPYVNHECDTRRRACWLSDPQNPHQEWILFGEDATLAEELERAVSRLILSLQQAD